MKKYTHAKKRKIHEEAPVKNVFFDAVFQENWLIYKKKSTEIKTGRDETNRTVNDACR